MTESGVLGRKRPWWLIANSRNHALFSLIPFGLMILSVLLREPPWRQIDYWALSFSAVALCCAIVSVITFIRHPEWNNARFEVPSLTRTQIRWYSWVVGISLAAAVACVIFAIALATWSLIAVALIFVVIAVITGSNIGRRTVDR